MSLNGNDDFKAASGRISEVAISPASPTPSGDIPLLHAPIIIPTEKIQKTAESLSSSCSKTPFLENITPNKEINKVPSDMLVNNSTQNIGGSWYESNNSNFKSENTTNLMSALLPSSHKQPMINNPSRGKPFIQPSSGSSNMQDHYAAYNQMNHRSNMVHVNNQMVHQNKFILPQQNLMGQNIPANYGENSHRNTFVLQNNVGNNISHTQLINPFNATPIFYPYGPTGNNSEYDLSRMPPPGRPPHMVRSKYYISSQRNKGKWHRGRSHAHHLSRDPRTQAQSNIQEPPAPPLQIERRRKSVDEYSRVGHTKFDAAYSNSGCGKGEQESFVSPLENLYATGEAPQKTRKGYGLQKFRIPNKKNDIGGRYNNEWKKEEKTESCKERIKDQVAGITLKQQKSFIPERKGETKLEKAENTVHPTPTISVRSSTSTNEEKNSNEHVKREASLIDILASQRHIEDLLNSVCTSLSGSRGEQEQKKFERIQKIIDSDTDDEHEKPVKKKAEDTGSKTKSKQNEKIIKEKQTKKEITMAEVKVKTITTADKEIKTVEKEDIPKETETKEETEKEKDKGDKENKENEKLLKLPEISLRKRKRHGGQKKRQKVEALQSKQAPEVLKVNIKNKKKVYCGAKLDENVIETIAERIKIKRQRIKTPEPTKVHKCEKGDLEETVNTNSVSASNFRNKHTSSDHDEPTSVLDSPKRRARSENESLKTTRLKATTSQINRRKGFVEPDKNYYFDPQDKSECKLCSFKGKMIVQHYKHEHSKYEVLISRIAPDNASTAIKESIENGYEDVKVENTKNRRKKFTYRCRFCQEFFINENSENFFNHLTGHTGEYRFTCRFCLFKTANGSSLRSHMYSVHNANAERSGSIMPAYRAPPNFHIVFGFICAKCNFIQMDKTAVETHMKIYHLGENEKIYKINMSTVVSKPTEVPEENALAEVGEEVSKKQVEQKEVRLEPPAQELQSEAVKEVIKGDPTVLKPNTDYVQEDIELDEQQQEKMKKMSKTIISWKEVNLLDSTADVITSASKKNLLQEGFDLRKAKSDAKCSMKSNVEKPIVNETSVPISPSLLPSNEFEIKDEPLNEFEVKTELIQKEVIARVGPVGATKENGCVLYICYTQSCIFSCTLQSEFATHCKNLHGNELWDGFCNICSINTHLTKVDEAYEHLLSMHSNDFDDDKQRTTIESCESQSERKYVRTHRISGDRLSKSRLDGSNNVDSVSVKTEQEEVLEDTYSSPSSPPIASTPTSELTCPVKAKSQLTRLELIELTDTPLLPHELEVPRKTPYAMTCLLSEQKLVHLYKCPERNCTYSTDSKKQFKSHIQQHKEFNSGIQIPCLYCNFKTDFDYIGVHYDIKHGQCQYCCVYCLYRGRVQSYVEMHQEGEHSKNSRQVLTVPINPDASKSQAVIPLPPLKNVIPLYECGQLGCLKKFIFSEDFGEHLRSVHTSPLICFCCQYKATSSTALIGHMINHNICFFHCRYCMLGATTMEDIYKHLSHQHFAMLPRIVFRCFWPGKSVKRQSDFAMDSPELMEHMKLYSVEDLKCVTPNAGFEMTLASTSKELTIDKNPIAISESPKAALQNNEKEPVTLCKGQKETENDADLEVSDDETSAALKDVNSGQVLPNTLVNNVRPASPIILKKIRSLPKKLLTLSQYLASSTASVATEKIMTSAPPTVVEIKTKTEAILEEPLLEMTLEDVDSLQLVPQTSSTSIDESNADGSTEGKLNSMNSFGYDDNEALQEFPDLTAEVSCSVENITKKQDLTHRPSVTSVTNIPIAPKKYENEFVVHSKLERQKSTNNSHGISSNASSASDEANKQLYLTREEVPVPAVAPVSRVPCLEKNKKVFDKTINLAPSSFTATRMVSKIEKKEKSNLFKAEETQLPEFVSATKRYVCGVDYCNRLCCEESELRYHLQASHTDESAYRCPHCSKKLSSEKDVINVDSIIKHLRLHDLQLYKCSDCTFSHNLKQQVEKHVCDEHTDKLATVIIVRETPHDPEKPHHKVNKEMKPWHCGMCEYQCTIKKEIMAHVYNKHGLHTKYKCNLCGYRKNKIASFSNHFRTDHPGLNADVIHAYYQVEATSISSKESLEDLIRDSIPQLPEGDENQSPKESLVKPFNLLSKREENSKVIEIYDDLEDEKPVIRSMAEINKMDISELKNRKLHGTCGPYGKPFKTQFACPLCLRFKTTQTEDITNHLYKELRYHRYACTRCGSTRVTYKFLQKHSARKHPNLPKEIQPLPRDRNIEDWVQTLLLVQRRLILDNESLVSGTTHRNEIKNKSRSVQRVTSLNRSGSNFVDDISSTSSAFDVDSSTSKGQLDQRQHCSSKYKAASNMRDMEGFTNAEVIEHSKRGHPKMTSTIEMRKRKYPTSTWGLSSSSDEVQAKQPALEINEDHVKAGGNADYAYMLMCNYCPKQCVTEAELRVHWEAMHKVQQPQFKYKIVRRS